MRPLVLLVLAESALIVLLALLWSNGAPAAASQASQGRIAEQPHATLAAVAAPGRAAALPAPERQAADPLVPVAADDPIGILVGGTVRSTDGSPVADANVYFRRGDEYRGGSTQPNGSYAAAGLQPGEWRLSARADGFSPNEVPVTFDQRSFQRFDLELRPAYSVKVRIQNAAGEFLPDLLAKRTSWGVELGVVATAVPLAGDLPVTEHTMYQRFGAGESRTNSGRGGNQDNQLREQGFAGELRLDQDPPVCAALILRHVVLQTQRIEPGQHEVVFTIEVDDVTGRLGTVKLRLVDVESGQPLAKVRVTLDTAQGNSSGGITDDDGYVTMEKVVPGLLCVSAFMKDREWLNRYVRMPAAGKLDLGEIRVSAAIMITGTALDEEGKPVTDANFHYDDLDARTFPQPLFDRMSSPVDGSGQTKLRLGRHRYVVFAQSRTKGFGHAMVDAGSGAPGPVTITLRKPTRVEMRAHFDTTVGYLVTFLDRERWPVRTLWLGGEYRPDGTTLPAGTYTVEITDAADRQVRSFALTVGSEPVTIDVP